MKEVVIVAGHAIGGDPGAIGQGTTEAVETVQAVDWAQKYLLPHPTVGVDVVPHNLDYVASTDWINARYKFDPDTIVVEVHLNAPAVASGTETLVGVGGLSYPETKRLATCINNAVVEQLGLRNRGIKEQNLYLIQSCNPLACLVELRFIGVDDNSDETDRKSGLGIANGICDYFNQPRPLAVEAPVSPVPVPVVTPVPIVQPTPTIAYYVKKDGKQLGAYNVELNAWAKYQANPGSIILDGTGADVTGKFVERFAPPVIIPDPIQPPVVDEPDYAKENNGLLKWIIDLLKKIFNIKD